jgi:hypothetical protein
MRLCSIYKVPNGKLLRISLTYNESMHTIHQVKVAGDFFAYPEEAVDLLENELENALFTRDSLRTKIQSIINKYHIQFIGIDAEGLTQALLMCKP